MGQNLSVKKSSGLIHAKRRSGEKLPFKPLALAATPQIRPGKEDLEEALPPLEK